MKKQNKKASVNISKFTWGRAHVVENKSEKAIATAEVNKGLLAFQLFLLSFSCPQRDQKGSDSNLFEHEFFWVR
jgi:hypothetical protein